MVRESMSAQWKRLGEEKVDLRAIAKDEGLSYKQLKRYCNRGLAVITGRRAAGSRWPVVILDHERIGNTIFTTREAWERFKVETNGG